MAKNIFERAATVQRQYREAINQIEGDDTLSAVGKSQAMAKAYVTAERQMRAFRDERQEQVTGERERLERAAYRVAEADMLNFRDASDRAEQLENVEVALARLQRAALAGDTIMMRAIGQHAYRRQWTPVFRAYTEADPAGGKTLSELAAFEQERSSVRIHENMAFSVQQPHGVTPMDVNQARGADAATEAVAI